MDVYLYGTGSGGMKAFQQMQESEEINIIGFLDSDKSKGNSTFMGKNIYYIEQIRNNFDKIIICSNYESIYYKLLNQGIGEQKIICFFQGLQDSVFYNEYKKTKELRSFLNLNSKNKVITKKMAYEKDLYFDEIIVGELDYFRYKTLYLLSEEIHINNIKGAVAEVGVYRGDFAKIINRLFTNRDLYLFDTFLGFDSNDEIFDINNKFLSKEFTQKCDFKDTDINLVLSNMYDIKRCKIKKGYFPDTARDLEEIFALVSIDVDLYKPIYKSLEYFYPRLSENGYLMIHDYNNKEFTGVKEAIKEYESNYKVRLKKVPISDEGGTIIIIK